MKPYFITALCTPLTAHDELHRDGLAIELEQQHRCGIDGVLALGTMGLMQLQSDAVCRDVVTMTLERFGGKGEVLIGAGDASFPRTRDRIAFLNTQKIDGVAVLAPYFFGFSQEELIGYYRALADFSRAPLYLYDLPQTTRTKLQFDTVLELSRHPNIKGIKCSDEPGYARALVDRVGDRFRVVIAQPDLIDTFLRHGINEHLDGMFALAPEWTAQVGRSCAAGEWDQAARCQQSISALRRLLPKHGAWATITAIMNARGVPGKMAPAPCKIGSESLRQTILDEPDVRRLIDAVK